MSEQTRTEMPNVERCQRFAKEIGAIVEFFDGLTPAHKVCKVFMRPGNWGGDGYMPINRNDLLRMAHEQYGVDWEELENERRAILAQLAKGGAE